jgi:hypothetical protein
LSTDEDEDITDGVGGGSLLTVGDIVPDETEEVSIDLPESAATQIDEACELLLLESASHIKIARVQRALSGSCCKVWG